MIQFRRSLAMIGVSALLVGACAGNGGESGDLGSATSQLTTVSSGSVTATLSVNQWNTGYYATVTLQNTGSSAASGWTVNMALGSATVGGISNALFSGTTGNVSARSHADWNRSIPAGGSISYGWQGNGTQRPELTSITLTSGGTGGSGTGGTTGSGGTTSTAGSPSGGTGNTGNTGNTAGTGNTGNTGGITAPPAATGNFSNQCDRFAQPNISAGYFANNNVWNQAAGSQCISMNGSVLTVTSATHNLNPNSPPFAPAAYPSLVRGCHYNHCTDLFPRQVSTITRMPSTFEIAPAAGTWNAAYDIWLDPTPRRDGANTGLEIMIWLNWGGTPQPIGNRTATAVLAGTTWEVWVSNGNENGTSRTISYRRAQQATAMTNFDAMAFVNDSIARGVAQRDWYITSVQAGFEIWNGGTGLRINRFSVGAQ